MIAIVSKKELIFTPSHKGYIKLEIDLIQNKPSEKIYEIRLKDTCFIECEVDNQVWENNEIKIKKVKSNVTLHTIYRTVKYKYSDISKLAKYLNIDFSNPDLTLDKINELFLKGLLLVTNQECENNQGIYFSKLGDWELL